MAMLIARLDDLPFMLGELVGGADIIGNDYDPFSGLYDLPDNELRAAIINDYVIPQMAAAGAEERDNIRTTLTYLIQKPVADKLIERAFDRCLLPIDVPKPYLAFLLSAFEAIFPSLDPYSQPPAATFLS